MKAPLERGLVTSTAVLCVQAYHGRTYQGWSMLVLDLHLPTVLTGEFTQHQLCPQHLVNP